MVQAICKQCGWRGSPDKLTGYFSERCPKCNGQQVVMKISKEKQPMTKECPFFEAFPPDVCVCHAGAWGNIKCDGDTDKCEVHTRFDAESAITNNLRVYIDFVSEKCGDMLKSVRNAKETLEDMQDGIDEWDVNPAGLYGDLSYIESILQSELCGGPGIAMSTSNAINRILSGDWTPEQVASFEEAHKTTSKMIDGLWCTCGGKYQHIDRVEDDGKVEDTYQCTNCETWCSIFSDPQTGDEHGRTYESAEGDSDSDD